MKRNFFRRLSAPYRGNQSQSAWYLQPFLALMTRPVYFSGHRRPVTQALALGFAIGILPFPGHTLAVVLVALLLRLNLPVIILSIWIANPLTYYLIFYGEYRLGQFLLQLPPLHFPHDASVLEILRVLIGTWKPLWLGALVSSLVLGISTYLLSNGLWRLIILGRIRRRAAQRQRIPQ